MTITTLIFDIDGVLVDFVDLHRQTFIRAFNTAIGSDKLTVQIHDEHLDNHTSRAKLRMCRDLFPEEDWDDDEVYRLKQEITLQQIRDTPVTDRVFKVLDGFKRQGYRMGCYTNTNRTVMKIVLTKLGLWDLFDCKISNQDVTEPKPGPEGYVVVMDRLRASPLGTLIFEDSVVGLTSATASGAIPVPVRDSLEMTTAFVQNAIEQAQRLAVTSS